TRRPCGGKGGLPARVSRRRGSLAVARRGRRLVPPPKPLGVVAGLALNLLGSPAVARSHGTPARGIGAAKNIALLAYLTLEPGARTREELAAMLWGESSDAAARASLRQALKRLRAAVGWAERWLDCEPLSV